MENKTLPPVNVLFFSTQTTLKQIGAYVLNIAKQLYAESIKQDLLPTGPVYWVYYGADGKPDTNFTLEIALPVNHSPIGESLFKFKQLPVFKCMEATHNGAWDQLPATYGKLMPAILVNGHQLTGITREVYLNIDLNQPENNITIIQVGIMQALMAAAE